MNIRHIFLIADATKKQKELILKWAQKSGKDYNKIIEWVESAFKTDAEQFAAASWIIQGFEPKTYGQALYICQQKKLDPMKQNPEELVANNADLKKKEKPINPDEVLTDKQEDGEGNVTYAARDEDREVIRQIINTHYGVDANPWCLMQARDGELTEESKKYWNDYSAYPKRIAFRNGKLLAFSAGTKEWYREYWDRSDRSFPFIPYNGKTWEGEYGATYTIQNGHVFVDRHNDIKGRLSETYSDNIEYAEEDIQINPQMKQICIDGEGETWYPYIQNEKGNYVINEPTLKCTVTPDLLFVGEYQRFYDNGQLKEKSFYKNGKLEGEYQYFHSNGQLGEKCFHKNGKLEGEFQSFYENGQLKEKSFYKDGEREGEYQRFYENGQLKEKSFYKDGHQVS